MKDITGLTETYEVAETISASPTTGLGRVACYANLQHHPARKIIYCLTNVYTMKNGLTVEDAPDITKYYEVLLTVSNDVEVDPNGIVTPTDDQIEGVTYIGEYDYYIALIKNGVNIFDIVRGAIAAADASGRFDIRN